MHAFKSSRCYVYEIELLFTHCIIPIKPLSNVTQRRGDKEPIMHSYVMDLALLFTGVVER